MPYGLMFVGGVLVVLGLPRDPSIFLLWGPGLALALAGWVALERRRYQRRERARRRGGYLL